MEFILIAWFSFLEYDTNHGSSIAFIRGNFGGNIGVVTTKKTL